jgi:hypothetical protein
MGKLHQAYSSFTSLSKQAIDDVEDGQSFRSLTVEVRMRRRRTESGQRGAEGEHPSGACQIGEKS